MTSSESQIKGEVSYIEPDYDKGLDDINEDTTKACWMLRSELKKCILESDCIQKDKMSPRDCLKGGNVDVSCRNLQYTYYQCRRSILDMRTRFRGRKGDVG